jgi:hypothetical protein
LAGDFELSELVVDEVREFCPVVDDGSFGSKTAILSWDNFTLGAAGEDGVVGLPDLSNSA